ncbi:MAG: hypothetical protein DSY80_09450 [Desulfocapsa sp.]|nr:MAG: hypothetical protein DSY80_09450 [Desulfocapsa sp.]
MRVNYGRQQIAKTKTAECDLVIVPFKYKRIRLSLIFQEHNSTDEFTSRWLFSHRPLLWKITKEVDDRNELILIEKIMTKAFFVRFQF